MFITLNPLEKLLRPPLLEQTHQRTPDGLHLGRRYFRDPSISEDVRSRDLFEFEVPSHVRVN